MGAMRAKLVGPHVACFEHEVIARHKKHLYKTFEKEQGMVNMTLKYRIIVEIYSKPNGVVSGSILNCEIFLSTWQKTTLIWYLVSPILIVLLNIY